MSPALNYKALLYATPTHLPSICPFTRPHVIISSLSMHLPPVLWAWIRAPATHFLGARILTTLPLSIPPAAFSALPQHLRSPFSVIILSSQYLFQRGPIWMGHSLRVATQYSYVRAIVAIFCYGHFVLTLFSQEPFCELNVLYMCDLCNSYSDNFIRDRRLMSNHGSFRDPPRTHITKEYRTFCILISSSQSSLLLFFLCYPLQVCYQ